MRKMIIKLTAAALSLILAVTVAVMSSYAWLTLSESPAVNSIHIAIGGGSTILVAPDLTKTVDGETVHYPGYFDDTLNFGSYDSYAYLQSLGGMTPVSTADGVNWVLPAYYSESDPEVEAGMVKLGEMKPFSEFTVDRTLSNANLSNTQTDQIDQGSYIYLDFWVVSPGENYRLRVSTGDDGEGSFAVSLPEPAQTDQNGDGQADGYTLTAAHDAAAASVRIGFLASETVAEDADMLSYLTSPGYSDRFTHLKGVYYEPGEIGIPTDYRFMIYEPNGTLHPDSAVAENGSYVITEPLFSNGTAIVPGDVSGNLTVQDTSTWLPADSGSGTMLEQVFQGTVVTEGFRSSSISELTSGFYLDYLQGRVGAYVDTGDFFKRTDNLYVLSRANLATGEYMEQEKNGSALLAGATDDAYIVDLERNVPQRIRMYIWLEGQDADCTNEVKNSTIAVSVELAGSNNGV